MPIALSRHARADLVDIALYTARRWDQAQAERYLSQLYSSFHTLANTPAMGRACDHVRAGLLRAESGSHVIFFRRVLQGLFICRVLHERMVPSSRPFDDEDE